MNVLVTGARGFIGLHLVKLLLKNKFHVRCLVRKGSDISSLKELGVQIIRGGLLDEEALSLATRDIHTVYHLAARVSDWGQMKGFMMDNVEGTKNLLNASVKNGVKRFVYMSSLSVHGFPGIKNGDEQTPHISVKWPYCTTKQMAERLVSNFGKKYGIEYTIIRTGTVYGPDDYRTFYALASAIQKGHAGFVGGGNSLMSPCYVENLVEGIYLAGTSAAAQGCVYNIVDSPCSWKEFFIKIASEIGAKKPRASLPFPLAISSARILEFIYKFLKKVDPPPLTTYRISIASKDFYFSNEKAKRELGFNPSVSLNEGIRISANWFKSLQK